MQTFPMNDCTTPSIPYILEPEIQVFNAQFNMYQGIMSGAKVKALLSKLSTNATDSQVNANRIPNIRYKDSENLDLLSFQYRGDDSMKRLNELNRYQTWISNWREKINNKDVYNIELGYDESYINFINITKVEHEVQNTVNEKGNEFSQSNNIFLY